MSEDTKPSKVAIRYVGLDQIRGIGVLLMIIFHFCYDLMAYRFPSIPKDSTLFWYWLPRLIVFIFLFCVGVSLRIAHYPTPKYQSFFKRFAQITGAAILISITTYFLFPDRWVYFGTLHCIALCSIVALPLIKYPKTCGVLSFVIIAPVLFFDFKYPWINLGIKSMDYEPLLPWLYVSLLGIFIESTGVIKRVNFPKLLGGPFLEFLGKKAFVIYLLHQPILFGLVGLAAKLTK